MCYFHFICDPVCEKPSRRRFYDLHKIIKHNAANVSWKPNLDFLILTEKDHVKYLKSQWLKSTFNAHNLIQMFHWKIFWVHVKNMWTFQCESMIGAGWSARLLNALRRVSLNSPCPPFNMFPVRTPEGRPLLTAAIERGFTSSSQRCSSVYQWLDRSLPPVRTSEHIRFNPPVDRSKCVAVKEKEEERWNGWVESVTWDKQLNTCMLGLETSS